MKRREVIVVATLMLASAVSGFFVGRGRTCVDTRVEYVYLPEIQGTVKTLEPVRTTFKDVDIRAYLRVPDTVRVDSAAIIREFFAEKEYDIEVFDNDTTGRLTLNAGVSENEMQWLDWRFTPIQKTISVRKPGKFVLAGYDFIGNSAHFGVGKWHGNSGFYGQSYYNFSRKSVGFGFGIALKW